MQGKTTPADGARDFLEGVKFLLGPAGQAKDADAGLIGRTNQLNGPLAWALFGHIIKDTKYEHALASRAP